MSLGKFSWREVRARPSRVILTFLSIAIGVGAVVAVLLATSTTRSAQRNMLKAVSGKADLEVLANSPQGFSYELTKTIRDNPRVAAAVPSLNRVATIFIDTPNAIVDDALPTKDIERKTRTQVLGIDPRIDQQIRDYEVSPGRMPQSLDEILLDVSLARSLEIEPGDSVKLLAGGGLQDFNVSGLLRPTGQSGLSLGGAVYLVLPAAQRLFRAGSNIDQILVLADDQAAVPELLSELEAATDGSVTIRIPRTSSDMAQETMYSTENGMHMAIAFALLIAAFIIYNTFQMAVGERRKQLGILRAIGATRSQVSGIILREALSLSVLGAAAGCLLGYWGAGLLNGVTEELLQVELPRVHVTFLPFVVATVVGIGVAMLGALLPARRAGQVQPMEAMRAIDLGHNAEVIRRTKPIGLIAIPTGFLLLATAIQGWLPVGADVVAIVQVLLGCVLLIPFMLESVTRVLAHFLRHWLGFEAWLAQKQLMRHVGRSTLTIGVLFIAVSTCVGMTGNILDNVDNVKAWYTRAIIGDFFIRASNPNFATGAAADLPPDVLEAVRDLDGVEYVEPMSFISAHSGDDTVVVITREFTGTTQEYFDVLATGKTDVIDALNEGQAVVGSVLAQRRELAVGDQLALETESGSVELKVAAITNEYIAGGLTIYLSTKTAQEHLGLSGTSALIVTASKNQLTDLESRLQGFCRERGLILQSHKDMVAYIHGMVNGVIASMWMLLGLGCVIATMGLVNTLTMNILEQTREIGMLRVVAMTRDQIRRMIIAQAAMLGLLGLLPGGVAGVFVAYAISQSSMMVLGHNVIFQFRPGLVLGCLVFGALIISLASLIPAERAARLKLATALHYE